jgi:hypothetical protein
MLSFTNYAQAQLADADPDWVELESSPPAKFNPLETMAFDLTNSATQLKWGIEPSTISIGKDGITRYVVVANGENIANISYEGINCLKGELKIYARWTGKDWALNSNAKWINLTDRARAHHALALARQGLCDGGSAHLKVENIIRSLKSKTSGRTTYR